MIGEMRATQGFVYLLKPVGMDGPYKIGFSATPVGRLQRMMAWSPYPLEIVATCPGTFGLEQRIHGRLHAAHSHSEWFFATDEVRRFAANLKAGQPVEQAVDLSGPIGSIRKRRSKGCRSPAVRAAFGLTMRKIAAMKRSARLSGERYFCGPDVEAEIEAVKDGKLPSGSIPAQLALYISDPIKHGIPYSKYFNTTRPDPGLEWMLKPRVARAPQPEPEALSA